MTHVPSAAPSLVTPFAPTIVDWNYFANEYYSQTSWDDILLIFWYQLVVGGALWALFEGSRSKYPQVYSPRRRWLPAQVPAERPKAPFGWIPPVALVGEEETLERCGLDAYMLLRFIKLCARLSLFTSAAGCLLLLPVFQGGGGGLEGFNRLTLNNLAHPAHMWTSTGLMVVFTLRLYWLLDCEYKNYVKWRIAYLMQGSVDQARYQARYTIMLEGLPPSLRTNAALERYLERIFPGQVFSATVALQGLGALDLVHARRLQVVDQLERAVAFEHVTGRTRTLLLHRGRPWSNPWTPLGSVGRWRDLLRDWKGAEVGAVQYLRRELAALNEAARRIQLRIHAEQRTSQQEHFEQQATQRATQQASQGEGESEVPAAGLPGGGSPWPGGEGADKGAEMPDFGSAAAAAAAAAGEAMDERASLLGGRQDEAVFGSLHGRQQQAGWLDLLLHAASGLGREGRLCLDGAGAFARRLLDRAGKWAAAAMAWWNKSFATQDGEARGEADGGGAGGGGESFQGGGVGGGVGGPLVVRSGTGFATFTSLSTVKTACSVYLTHKPHVLAASLAPDPEDLIWPNVALPAGAMARRRHLAALAYLMLLIGWSVVVSLCSSLGTSADQSLERLGLDRSAAASTWYAILLSLCVDYLPLTLQLGLLALVPVVAQFTATRWEGLKSRRQVQLLIYSRYFLFQMMNVFVTIGPFSLFTFAANNDVSGIPQLLVQTFPKTGGYFIEFVLVKTMFGLPWELSRAWAFLQMAVAWAVSDRRQWTLRSQREAYLNTPELLYGWVYPSVLSVAVILMAYMVVTPMVSPFCLAYFLGAELVYKNQALHVYTDRTSGGGGGILWNEAFRGLMVGLLFAHLLLGCCLLVHGARGQAALVFVLMLADLAFADSCRRAYELPSKVSPLEVATKKDQSDARRGAVQNCAFSNMRYEQPALRLEEVKEETWANGEDEAESGLLRGDKQGGGNTNYPGVYRRAPRRQSLPRSEPADEPDDGTADGTAGGVDYGAADGRADGPAGGEGEEGGVGPILLA